jgi:hypothetical protein
MVDLLFSAIAKIYWITVLILVLDEIDIKDIVQMKIQIAILIKTRIEIALVLEIMKRMIFIQNNQEIIISIEITLIIIAIQMTHIKHNRNVSYFTFNKKN